MFDLETAFGLLTSVLKCFSGFWFRIKIKLATICEVTLNIFACVGAFTQSIILYIDDYKTKISTNSEIY